MQIKTSAKFWSETERKDTKFSSVDDNHQRVSHSPEKKREHESDGGGFRRASTAVETSGNSKRTAEIGYGE
ncbi:hypothetical protein TIFTF001_026698 [Ficus carica]|uniref:Uncharacterized protein n=1 Tax=Ficus carica TaxID=3494 RepID=A0AA88DLQ9_FICCA|nr:hypothetical protein TIFTF001_026698 [Ficus carica]